MRPTRYQTALRPAVARLAAGVFLIAFLAILQASPAGAEEGHAQQFGDWRFSMVKYDSGERFFVIRTRDMKSQDVELQIFKPVVRCEKTIMRIALAFAQPTTKTVDNKNVSGELRVDDAPMHKTVSAIYLPQGDKVGFIMVNSFENPGSVLTEMQNGQVIRFRFLTGDNENFQRFSLNGFGQAMEALRQACAQSHASRQTKGQPQSGQRKGKSQHREKESDADFFAPQSSSTPSSSGKKSDKDFF